MIFEVVVLIFSAIIHEYMHGWMADRLGDTTAKDMGRLTLNPIPHIDIFGSIILPFILVLSHTGFVFGWAKPVPYNPYNLRDQRYGGAKVALAGPLGNFILALGFGLIIRLVPNMPEMVVFFFALIVFINILLMVFNLLPIPPLDGSKVLMPFLPYQWQTKFAQLERYGMLIVLMFVIFGFQLIFPLILAIFKLIVGSRAAGLF